MKLSTQLGETGGQQKYGSSMFPSPPHLRIASAFYDFQ